MSPNRGDAYSLETMTVRGEIEEMGRGVFDKERVWEEGGFRCNGLNSKIRGMIRGLVFRILL